MGITQPRVARNELPWDNGSGARYPERVPSARQGSQGSTGKRRLTDGFSQANTRLDVIGAWSLVFLWCLELGAWSFELRSVFISAPDRSRSQSRDQLCPHQHQSQSGRVQTHL